MLQKLQTTEGRPEQDQTVPRSWSLWGRCSGRSGGTFLTSDFFSTGQSSQVSVSAAFLSQNIKNTREEIQRRHAALLYLWCVWLRARWEEAVSLVSENTRRHRSVTKTLQERVASFKTSSASKIAVNTDNFCQNHLFLRF